MQNSYPPSQSRSLGLSPTSTILSPKSLSPFISSNSSLPLFSQSFSLSLACLWCVRGLFLWWDHKIDSTALQYASVSSHKDIVMTAARSTTDSTWTHDNTLQSNTPSYIRIKTHSNYALHTYPLIIASPALAYASTDTLSVSRRPALRYKVFCLTFSNTTIITFIIYHYDYSVYLALHIGGVISIYTGVMNWYCWGSIWIWTKPIWTDAKHCGVCSLIPFSTSNAYEERRRVVLQ